MSEYRGGCIAEVGIDELTGDDLVPVEGLTVGEVGVRLAGVGGGVVPVFCHLGAHDWASGGAHHPPCVSFSFASSSSLPGSGKRSIEGSG